MREAVAQVYEWMSQNSYYGGELVLIGLQFSGTGVRGVYVRASDGADATHQLTPEFWP